LSLNIGSTGITTTLGFNNALISFNTSTFFLHVGNIKPAVTGGYNTAIGHASGQNFTSGNYCTFVGSQAGIQSTTGSSNTMVGLNSGYYQTGNSNQNTMIGAFCGQGTGLNSYSNNVAMGYQAIYNVGAGGGNNTAIGTVSCSNLTTGTNNTAIGYNSGPNIGSAINSCFVGAYAGASFVNGSLNTYLGYNSTTGDSSCNNEVVIGANVTGQGTNTTTIGGNSITSSASSSGFSVGIQKGSQFSLVGSSSGYTGLNLPAGHSYLMWASTNGNYFGSNNQWFTLQIIFFMTAGYGGFNVATLSSNNIVLSIATSGNVNWQAPGGSGTYVAYVSAIRLH
jgi:hypothetical protein